MPFVVRWPGTVKPGTVCEQLVHHADVIATVADIVGIDLPHDAGEDSFSLLPLLQGGHEPVRDHAVSQSSAGQFALRRSDWKMIFGPSGGGAWSKLSASPPDGSPAQLYHLTADLGETKNLYAEHPDIVQEMTSLLENLLATGRSTTGPMQKNDVPVDWQRFMKAAAADR